MQLIAKLWINLRQSAQLRWTVWVSVVTAAAQRLLWCTNTWGEGDGGE